MQPNDATYVGSLGVGILLFAFFLNLSKLVRTDSYTYSVLNVVGAGLACYSSYLINFLPFVVLEGTWSVAAAIALIRRMTADYCKTTEGE